MAPRKRYQLDRVTVEAGDSRPATWTFAGEAMSGTERSYLVTDGNFTNRNTWEFVVRVPKARGMRLEVRPRTTPNLKVWAELTDRSLTFARATKGGASGRWYCQVALADPKGEKTKDVVKGEERHKLPQWFDALQGRMRVKQNVRPTKGTDGQALVAVEEAVVAVILLRRHAVRTAEVAAIHHRDAQVAHGSAAPVAGLAALARAGDGCDLRLAH